MTWIAQSGIHKIVAETRIKLSHANRGSHHLPASIIAIGSNVVMLEHTLKFHNYIIDIPRKKIEGLPLPWKRYKKKT